MNVSASAPIAKGRTAEIYAWEERQVIKLYRDWCPPDWVDYEARIAGAIHEAGIPSPQVGGIVKLDGRRGLLYQRIEGISMLEDLNAHPWMMLRHAYSLAELQAAIHQKSIAGLPSYKDRLRYDIDRASQLTGALREKALDLLEDLPDGMNVCHGDFHPGNILLTKQGPIVIDWMTACSGSPWADVARTSLLLSIGAKAAGKQVSPIVRAFIGLFHRLYINRYRSLRRERVPELDRWRAVIAAARLSEEIAPEREVLLEIIKGS